MRKTLLITALSIVSLCAKAQELTIEKWLNGKKSATVLTFDDWSPGQGFIVVPLCIQKEIPATIYVTTSHDWAGGGFAQMNYAAANKIELGNHTINHPKLSTVDDWTLDNEVTTTKTLLEEKAPNQQQVLTLAYPHGDFNQKVIDKVKENHIAARIFEEDYDKTFTYEFATTEDDYYKVQEIRVNADLTSTQYKNWMQHGIDNNGLMVFTFHSVYNNNVNDYWYDAVSESYLSTFIDDVKSYQNETWITTFADAIRYHKEAHCASIDVKENTDELLTFTLQDTLSNNGIYNIPLTLRLTPEEGSLYGEITQNNITISSIKDGDDIIFNVRPDEGEIQIKKQKIVATTTAIEQNIFVYPNPVQDVVSFSKKVESVQIMSAQGQVVLTANNVSKVNVTDLASGLYIVLFVDGEYAEKISFVKE